MYFGGVKSEERIGFVWEEMRDPGGWCLIVVSALTPANKQINNKPGGYLQ